jgi:UDP-N-acetylglucosamine 1-carboxyvinyltransferase
LNKVEYSVVSDRIEAGSFAIASSLTMGNDEIDNVNPKNLDKFLKVLASTGSKVEVTENSINVSAFVRP